MIKKLNITLYILIAVMFAGGICLANITMEFVATKIYPITKVTIVEKEQEFTIAEHICLATNGENCEVLVNLARCESSLEPQAYHINTNRTVDLGLFQWNSVHYKTKMTPSCALDVYCSARATNDEINAGRGHIWVCWDKI